MKLNKTTKIILISLGILTCISITGIVSIVKNNREKAKQLEQDRLEQKISNLEEQLKNKDKEDTDKSDEYEENTDEDLENINEEKSKDYIEEIKPQISAMDMYNNAKREYNHLAVRRFFNYYMAVYDTIEKNYDSYSSKDMYEVADKFLNDLYSDIKDHGGVSEELLQEQRIWVKNKLNNFDKNDYVELYRYTMNRCHEFIEIYK